MNKLIKFLRNKIYYKLFNPYTNVSYSQCGEDLIVSYLLKTIGITNPIYLDIGTNNPIALNNTYKFYLQGCRGCLVEPDPQLYSEIVGVREKDICLNVGLGKNNSYINYYVMTTKTLNTFSRQDAEKCVNSRYHGNQKIEKVCQIEIRSVAETVIRYVPKVNFVSIDVEGMEMEILKAFPFDKIRPEVFCIETLEFTSDNKEVKCDEIIGYMVKNGYLVYSDTHVNTIFVDAKSWKN